MGEDEKPQSKLTNRYILFFYSRFVNAQKKEGGLCTLADYPYQGVAGECAEASCDLVPGSELFEFDDVPPQSTAALMEALTHQPVSVASVSTATTLIGT